MKGAPLLPRGTLLLSAPDMLDPIFMHTVVLMIDHREDGAMGVVVNRRGDVRVGDLLGGHGALGACDEVVWSGGPVGLDSLQILHRPERDAGPGAAPQPGAADAMGGLGIGPEDQGLYLGADLEILGESLGGKDPALLSQSLRFLVGYAGWGPGQLEAEIQQRSWLPLGLDGDVVFAEPSGEAAWRLAMSRLQGEGATLAHQPPDPRWN